MWGLWINGMSERIDEMTVAVEEPRSWAKRLTITVPSAHMERERQEIARGLAKRLRLPGFRRGKVPAHVIERQYGQAIQQQTIERVVSEAYKEAVQREGLRPITEGEVERVDYQPGTDLTFDVEFEVRPDIELPRLGGFTIPRPPAEVRDEEVEQVLDRLRDQQSVWHPVEEGKPGSGDRVEIAVQPEGAEEESYEFVLGSGEALEEIESAISDLTAGEEDTVTLPGKTGETSEGEEPERRLRIRLTGFKRAERPELSDEFAQSVGDFEDLETLCARVREDLAREAEAESERAVRQQLLDHVVEANPFDVPESMVDGYLDQILRPRDGADSERVNELRTEARPAAERALKRMLVIDRVAEMHDLRATPEDVDGRVETLAEQRGRPPGEVWAQLQKSGQLGSLEENITEERVFTFLKAESKID